MSPRKPSLSDLILQYFVNHPMEDLEHDDWIDFVSSQFEEINDRLPRDPWRSARKLHQDGYLVKVRNGVYRYDPDFVHDAQLENFNAQQKSEILERDQYRCVVCGRGRAEGVTLHVDHIKPKDLGGRATVQNGQTLCAQHNFLKKNLNASETGKRLLIRLYELAKEENIGEMVSFCREVLEVYDKYDVNGHIEWKP